MQWALWIIRRRRMVIICAAVMLVPALFGMARLKVEYDLSLYLPSGMSSVEGLHHMERAFGFSSEAVVVARGFEDWEVEGLRDDLDKIPGVKRLFWLSDVTETSFPPAFQGEAARQFRRGDAAVLQVWFAGAATSRETRTAIAHIRKRLGPGLSLLGTQVVMEEMRKQSEREKLMLIAVSVLSLAVVLLLALPSYLAPVLFLMTLGCGVAWNMGLGYFLGGRMFYVTDSFGPALQMGVTMDYCIFLFHRFEEERRIRGGAEEAMVHALRSTAGAISASSLTTIAGFYTLSLMRMRIGADVGLTMARGVVLSVAATIIVLPALILMFLPALDRLKHRPLLPSFSRLGGAVVRRRAVLAAVLAMAMVPAWLGHTRAQVTFDIEKTFSESLPSMVAVGEMRRNYGVSETANVITHGLPDWQNVRLEQQLRNVPGVLETSSFFGWAGTGIPPSFAPEPIRARYSANGYYNIELSLADGAAREPSFAENVRKLLGPENGAAAWLTGQTIVDRDLQELAKKDMTRIDQITPLVIGILVALTFRSLLIPIVLILAIECAIWANQSMVAATGGSMFFFAAIALSCIQLGSTVDYAILVTSRFREERCGRSPAEAMVRAINRSAGAIMTSGATLCAATLGIFVSSSMQLIKELALLLAKGAIISVLVTVFLLPATLVVFDGLIMRTTIAWPGTENSRRPRRNSSLGRERGPG